MGGPLFTLADPVAALRLAASSAFFGEPMYYHTDAADSRKRKMTRPQRRAHLSDVEIAHLRGTLGAVDPQEWRGLSPSALMERAIEAALAFDPEADATGSGAAASGRASADDAPGDPCSGGQHSVDQRHGTDHEVCAADHPSGG